MKTTLLRFNWARPWRRLLIASSLSLSLAASLQARPVPQNLAGGLGALVESDIAVKAQPNSAQFNGYATQQAADYASIAIQDTDTGRFLVDIYPTNNRVNAEKLVPMLQERFPSFTLTALDNKYHGVGVVEGFIALDDVPALGNMREVRSVNLGLKPELNRPRSSGRRYSARGPPFRSSVPSSIRASISIGSTRSTSSIIRRAQLDFEGTGISIGFISDSIGNTATDVNNFDLPGAGNNPVNTQPVVILQDLPGTDEGRGMGQIVYKMAPKARIGFATANGGEVNFANNIRALAALPGFEYPPEIQKGFKADVICDDVGYSDEPFFRRWPYRQRGG